MLKDIIASGKFRTMGWLWNADGTVTVKVVPRERGRSITATARINEVTKELEIDEGTVIDHVERRE